MARSRALLAAAALCSLFALSAAIRPQTRGKPAGPACLTAAQCAAAECDFFFDGSPDAVPTFPLSGTLTGDTTLGGASALPVRVRDVPGFPVASWTALKIAAVQPGIPLTLIAGACSTGQQFLSNSSAFIRVKKFSKKADPASYVGNCIKLPFKTANLVNGTRNVNLNSNAANGAFPVARRCVVFQLSA